MFAKKASKDYKTIKEILDKRGIKFFATGGTCLGAIREGNFIEWDDDVDLGVIEPYSYKTKWYISEDLRKKKFNVYYEGTGKEGRHMITRNVLTAIHWLTLEGQNYVFYWPDKRLAFRIPRKYIQGFKEVKLGDSTIHVIDPPEPYLEVKFGKDWREPIKGKHSPAIMPY